MWRLREIVEGGKVGWYSLPPKLFEVSFIVEDASRIGVGVR